MRDQLLKLSLPPTFLFFPHNNKEARVNSHPNKNSKSYPNYQNQYPDKHTTMAPRKPAAAAPNQPLRRSARIASRSPSVEPEDNTGLS